MLQQHQKRAGTIYVAVVGVAVVVGVIGLTALETTRVERLRAVGERDRMTAQSIAQSSIELAVARISADGTWRTTLQHGTEYSVAPSGIEQRYAYRLLDPLDANLANNSNDSVTIEGIGRWGRATFLYQTTYARMFDSDELVGPLLLASVDSGTSTSAHEVDGDTWLAQYVLPSLPTQAVSYTITEIDVLAKLKTSANATLYVRVYSPNASRQPQTLRESHSCDKAKLNSSTYTWVTLPFTQVGSIAKGTGFCIALEGPSTNKQVEVRYEGGGVVQGSNRLIHGGSGAWGTVESDKALYYRVRGCYSTSNGATGEFQIMPGTWKRVAAP